MDTINLVGRLLYQKLHSQFRSVDDMIANSDGKISRCKRSTIYRSLEGRPIKRELAELIAETLGVDLSTLTAGGERYLRFTRESCLFNAALRLLRQNDGPGWHTSLGCQPKRRCAKKWLREQLSLSDDDLTYIVDELFRTGQLTQLESGDWVRVTPTLAELTRSLKRRIAFQWPIIRDSFAQSMSARQRTGRELLKLIDLAETRLLEPFAFFCVDDKIHECFCTNPTEVEMVQVSRSASWAIAHDVIADLTREMLVNPRSATRSMKAIGGWMIEDYTEWAYRLTNADLGDPKDIERGFRRHVLRMRDYAQYYRARDNAQGEGIS